MADTCLSKTEQNYRLTIQKYSDKGVQISITQLHTASKRWIACCMVALACLIAQYFRDEGFSITVCIFGFVVIAILWKLSRTVIEESLLVLKSVGLQIKLRYLMGPSVNHFVDVSNVQDVVINEGVKMHQVVCYISVLLSGRSGSTDTGLYPLFMNAQPSLSTLETIYRVVQPLLAES